MSNRRSLDVVAPIGVAVLLSLGFGALWFLWETESFRGSCAYINEGQPQPPSLAMAAVLVGVTAAAVTLVHGLSGKGNMAAWRRTIGYALLGVALPALALLAAAILYGATSNCYS